MKKIYEVNGTISYASVFSTEVEASSKKEADRIAIEVARKIAGNESVALSEIVLDDPIEIKA